MTDSTCRNVRLACAALVVAAMVSGCVAPVVVGAVGTTAVKATEERGLSGAWSDAEIHARVNKKWFDHDLDMMDRINLTVDDGRVLLTGRARTPDQRVDAVRLVWEVPGIKEVINEITIDNQASLIDATRDSWIATKLRATLLVDGEIHSTNYSIDVVNGVVYLMGVARSQAELERTIGYAKGLARVQGVVSHVRVQS